MEMYYRYLLLLCLIILAGIILLYLIRSVLGPGLADRMLAVNAIGTLTIAAVAILAAWEQEAYLLDVCLVYAMLSFLAMVVLSAMIHRSEFEEKTNEEALMDESEKQAGEELIRGKSGAKALVMQMDKTASPEDKDLRAMKKIFAEEYRKEEK